MIELPSDVPDSPLPDDRARGLEGLAAIDEAARGRLAGDGVAAIAAIRSAVAAFRESGQASREAGAWIQLGELLLWAGRSDAAVYAMRESRGVQPVTPGSHTDLRLRILAADVAREGGRVADARLTYRGVLNEAESAGFRAMRSLTLAKLGALFHVQQDRAAAERALIAAAEELEQFGDPRANAVRNNLGVVAIVHRDWKAGRECLREVEADVGGHPARDAAAVAAGWNLVQMTERRPTLAGWHWCRVSQLGHFVTSFTTVIGSPESARR